MATRTLDQVLSSLGSVYDPQIASVRKRQAAIPGQVAAEEQGLQAKQTSAFDEIVGGARRRGLGFSGIPIGEQAKYNATEYMPALARLRQGAREQALSLEDAILGINERRRAQAQSIYDTDRTFAEQRRQFNENLRLQREQMAAQQRAAASANSFAPTLGSLLGGSAGGGEPDEKTRAKTAVFNLFKNADQNTLIRSYNAISKSAGYGNNYDKMKL